MTGHIGDDIKAILFDHDDTLVGTIEAKWAEHKYIARRYYDKKLSDKELKKHWGKPLHELMSLLYETDDIEQAQAYNVAHHKDYPKLLFADTIATLEHLHKARYLTGIITATSRFSFEHDLKLHNISQDIIDYTQTADDTHYHKPDPRVFTPALAWLAKRRVQPHEVLYVGDGLHDMRAALRAGFRFLGVETGLVTAEQFAAEKIKSIPNIGHLIKPARV